MQINSIIFLFLALSHVVSEAASGSLRNMDQTGTRRNLVLQAEWHTSAYYWTLSAMILYFKGSCAINRTFVTCQRPGMTAKLVGQGSNSDPTAISLSTTVLQGGGNTKKQTWNFNGKMNPNQIMFAAFPNLSKFETLHYREALYDMMLYYTGPMCAMGTKNGDTITTCTIAGSYSILTGTGSGPTLQSVEKCTIMGGGNTICETWNFYARTDVRATLAEIFPGLH